MSRLQIEERMLTNEDDAIRAVDMPERLQLAYSSLAAARGASAPLEPLLAPYIDMNDLPNATTWVSTRLSDVLSRTFLLKDERGMDTPFATRVFGCRFCGTRIYVCAILRGAIHVDSPSRLLCPL